MLQEELQEDLVMEVVVVMVMGVMVAVEVMVVGVMAVAEFMVLLEVCFMPLEDMVVVESLEAMEVVMASMADASHMEDFMEDL